MPLPNPLPIPVPSPPIKLPSDSLLPIPLSPTLNLVLELTELLPVLFPGERAKLDAKRG